MIIERFFGKGRSGQPETQPQQASAPTPSQARAEKNSPAKNAEEPKPRRCRHRRPARRRRRGGASRQGHASKARPSAPAVAEPSSGAAEGRRGWPALLRGDRGHALMISGWRRAARGARSRELGRSRAATQRRADAVLSGFKLDVKLGGRARPSTEGDRFEAAGDCLHVGAGGPRAMEQCLAVSQGKADFRWGGQGAVHHHIEVVDEPLGIKGLFPLLGNDIGQRAGELCDRLGVRFGGAAFHHRQQIAMEQVFLFLGRRRPPLRPACQDRP